MRSPAAHGQHEKGTGHRLNTGLVERVQNENWPAWYVSYMVAEQARDGSADVTDLVCYLSGRDYKTPEQGAATSVRGATSPQLEGKGGVFCMDANIAELLSDFVFEGMDQQLRGVLPRAIDLDLAEQLWHLSEKMIGIRIRMLMEQGLHDR